MFYECAISPEALFEIAIDRRNYRDFIKGFSTGGNFLYSELPKLKRNKKQLLGLLNANHSELQKKRLEDLIIFLKNNKVSRRLCTCLPTPCEDISRTSTRSWAYTPSRR